MVLRNINLRLEPGKAIAIRAEGNRNGRTTLIQLMAGELVPTSGSIKLGDHNLADLAPATRSKALTYLPSKGAVLKGTILENITMFRPRRTQVALELSRRLGLDHIAARLPRGYETVVGDSDSDIMSQGVLQRISLVRGLAPQPLFVLFDEANSAIDSAGDVELRKILEETKAKAGLILISHRPSLLKLADETYALINGQLTRAEPKPAPAASTPTSTTR